MVNWNSFDLNLLRVLDTMLAERNTSRVGERIGLSQPAVSTALSRLRDVLGDRLFVREGNRMVPTPFAASLEEPLRQALGRIQQSLSGKPFDPARSTRAFRMLGDDFLAEMLLPPLLAHLRANAPGIRFQLLPSNPRPFLDQLAEGSIDFAFWIPCEHPEWVERALVLRASAVVVASRDNQALAEIGVADHGQIPIETYCDVPHVIFGPEANFDSREDIALARLGRRRNVVLTLPDFFGVARVASRSHLLGSVPPSFAASLAEPLGLRVFPYPFEVPMETLYLYWHRRDTDDPEHRWMRERILALLEPFDEGRHSIALA
jgi:DNA-binding transcriptional LysR family regulator